MDTLFGVQAMHWFQHLLKTLACAPEIVHWDSSLILAVAHFSAVYLKSSEKSLNAAAHAIMKFQIILLL